MNSYLNASEFIPPQNWSRLPLILLRGWWHALALGMYFQVAVLANLNLLPELHLHSARSSSTAPVSSVVRWVK